MPIQVGVPYHLLQVAGIGPETLKVDWGLPVGCGREQAALESQPLLLSDVLLTGLFPPLLVLHPNPASPGRASWGPRR